MGEWNPRIDYQKKELVMSVGVERVTGWLSGKESAWQCRRLRFNPWASKIPWSRKCNPSSILAWKIPQTEELGGLWSMGSQRKHCT